MKFLLRSFRTRKFHVVGSLFISGSFLDATLKMAVGTQKGTIMYIKNESGAMEY